MKTGHKEFPNAAWRELYMLALFESDKTKLAQRIENAHSALVLRGRELFHTSTENLPERQAVDAAMQALRVLSQSAVSIEPGIALEGLRSHAVRGGFVPKDFQNRGVR